MYQPACVQCQMLVLVILERQRGNSPPNPCHWSVCNTLSLASPASRRCAHEEMREELRKMKRKVSGTKAELQKRLEEVFEANDRGWLTRGAPALSKGAYLESGTFRDVYMVTYTKGPRKNMKGVYKVFKDQKAEVLIQEDLKAVEEAGRIIKAFNEYNDQCIGSSARRRVYLNQPEVWSLNGRPILVEPFIDGTYAKFNSNSGWVNEGYNMMQALSHFSFHVSNGHLSALELCRCFCARFSFTSHGVNLLLAVIHPAARSAPPL